MKRSGENVVLPGDPRHNKVSHTSGLAPVGGNQAVLRLVEWGRSIAG